MGFSLSKQWKKFTKPEGKTAFAKLHNQWAAGGVLDDVQRPIFKLEDKGLREMWGGLGKMSPGGNLEKWAGKMESFHGKQADGGADREYRGYLGRAAPFLAWAGWTAAGGAGATGAAGTGATEVGAGGLAAGGGGGVAAGEVAAGVGGAGGAGAGGAGGATSAGATAGGGSGGVAGGSGGASSGAAGSSTPWYQNLMKSGGMGGGSGNDLLNKKDKKDVEKDEWQGVKEARLEGDAKLYDEQKVEAERNARMEQERAEQSQAAAEDERRSRMDSGTSGNAGASTTEAESASNGGQSSKGGFNWGKFAAGAVRGLGQMNERRRPDVRSDVWQRQEPIRLEGDMQLSSRKLKRGLGEVTAPLKRGAQGLDPIDQNGVEIAAINELTQQVLDLRARVDAAKAKKNGKGSR